MKNYFNKHKKNLLACLICLIVILITSLIGSLVQSVGGSIEITDLRNATNTGTIQQRATYIDEDSSETIETTITTTVKGEVVSGILFKPKNATKESKHPGIVLTHGYLNNRELQLPFANELARRGFVVLTVDREGHGNYNNVDDASSMMATKGLYESAKYLYNLDYVDQTRIGISGHSMGGYTTAMALHTDNKDLPNGTANITINGKKVSATTYGLGIISSGVMQGWSTFISAGSTVDVGMLKADDDEFFYGSTDSSGNPTISREFLHSTGAANFVKVPYTKGEQINIGNGTYYVNGQQTDITLGTAINEPFRVIYEANEIHPLNHWSIPSTASLCEFFYTSFGTPANYEVIDTYNQVWWVREMFSFMGMIALLALIIPVTGLLLTIPAFHSLTMRKTRTITENGLIQESYSVVNREMVSIGETDMKGIIPHLYYWLPAIACTLFAGFIIQPFATDWANRWFPNTQLYPQDTTNWVALWSVGCGLFALLVILAVYLLKYVINYFQGGEQKAQETYNPFSVAKIQSFANALKTIALAIIVVFIEFLIVFINWSWFKTDFRLWTFVLKVFNVPEMLPTAIRYLLFFGLYYICQGIANQTYRVKNWPEWLTISINAFFNVFGIFLVMIIQYGTFKSTGVLWQGDMALGYIVLFPIIPVLITATIISRLLYKKTGNIWLGSLINAMLFTLMTVSNTAASWAYVLG